MKTMGLENMLEVREAKFVLGADSCMKSCVKNL